MISLEVASLFFGTSVLLSLAPGPDNIFVLTQSALHGRLAGWVVTLGLCTGLLLHSAAVALGVAAVFASSPAAFQVLKLLGVAYLLYLAWQSFRARAEDLGAADSPALGLRRLYLRGIIMNISNPKVAIFFLAFLPQFTDPAHGSMGGQILALGAVFICAAILVFGAIAWGAAAIGQRLRGSERAQLAMNRVAGTVFVALAVRLALVER